MTGYPFAPTQPLGGDWKIIHRISELPSTPGVRAELHDFTVESDRFNVVLKGSWSFIVETVGRLNQGVR